MRNKLRILAPIGRSFGAGEILTGPGCFAGLSYLKSSRIFIIHSPSFLNVLGGKTLISKTLKNKVYSFAQAPSGEPVIEDLMPLVRQIQDFKPDCIVAIGGGSVLDIGKLIWIFYEHPDITENELSKAFNIPAMRGKANFIAVPTTAGTGSEMSSAAIFQSNSKSTKKFAVSHELIPDIAILDPYLVIDVPRDIKINSAMDALAHSLEGYVSLFKNNYTQDLAEQSIRNIFASLEDYTDKPDINSADKVLRASNLAGIVQNISIPGLGHAISHSLSAQNIAHGLACGKFLPIAMKVNCRQKTVQDLYRSLALKLNFKDSETLIKFIESLLEKYQINISSELLSSLKSSEQFIENTLKDPTARANPVKLSKQEVIEAMELAAQ